MAQTRVPVELTIYEGESAILCQRVCRITDGVPITSGDVTGWTVEIYNNGGTTPGTRIYINGPLVGSAGYSDTLLNDCDNLMGDTLGRNFLTILDPSEIALEGGNTYRVWIKTSTTNGDHVQPYDVTVLAAN